MHMNSVLARFRASLYIQQIFYKIIFKWIYSLFDIGKYFLIDFTGPNNHFLESFRKYYERTIVFNQITSTYSERRWPWSQHPCLNRPRQIWPTGYVQQSMYNLKVRSSHRIVLPACLYHSLHESPGNLWCSHYYSPPETLCFKSSRRALACIWLAHTSECGLPGHESHCNWYPAVRVKKKAATKPSSPAKATNTGVSLSSPLFYNRASVCRITHFKEFSNPFKISWFSKNNHETQKALRYNPNF